MTQLALLGSAIVALALVVLGIYHLVMDDMQKLFGITVVVLGALALVLAERASRRRRAPWAYLIAMWGVISVCAFFAVPELLHLDKLKQVTVELELKHGPIKAREIVDDENVQIRLLNLGYCLSCALPFAGLCYALARGRRDYEQATS